MLGGLTLVNAIQSLEKVRKTATRMIEGCVGKLYKENVEIVGLITTLESRRTRADVMEVIIILEGFHGIDEKLFKRHTSHTRKLYKDRVNRDVLKFSFANKVIEKWNKLPEKVISANSISSFANNLDKYLKANERD